MKRLGGLVAALRSGEGLKGQLLRGGISSIAIKTTSTGLSLLLAIILARLLGAEEFGVYSFVFAIVTILAIPAQMGLPNLVVRETAKAQANEDWPLLKGLWRWSTLTVLSMSVALMIVGAMAAWILAPYLPEHSQTVFYWGLALVPFVALGNLRGAALRGLRKVVQGQLPEFILRPTFLIALMLIAHFGCRSHSLTAFDALVLHTIASFFAFIVGAWLLLKAQPQQIRSVMASANHSSFWLWSTIPLAIIQAIYVVNQNIGIVVLGILQPPTEVALYRIAMQGSLVISISLSAAYLVANPYISRLYAKGNISGLRKLSIETANICFVISAIIMFFYVVFGRQIILNVFGRELRDSFFALLILSSGQIFNAYGALAGSILTMTNREREILIPAGLSVIVNIVMSFGLGSQFGLNGVACATMLTVIFWNMFLLYLVRLRFGFWATATFSR